MLELNEKPEPLKTHVVCNICKESVKATVGLSNVFNDLYDSFENIPNFTIISNFIINNIAIIFVIILLFGFFINTFVYYNEYLKQEEKNNE